MIEKNAVRSALLLWLLLTTISNNSFAGIGTVTEHQNSASTVQRKANNLPLNMGSAVEMQDLIRTQKGKVGITFEDSTRVQVNENSKLLIDEFVYDPKSNSGKLGVKVALGTVRYASGQIAKDSPQNVKLSTPSATISVRGTDFTATVEELGQSTIILLPSCPDNRPTRTVNDIENNCVTGSIIVETDVGQVILDKPFQATRVENKSSVPSRPVILNLSEDAIGNFLILSPPSELKDNSKTTQTRRLNFLDKDFLKQDNLENELERQSLNTFTTRLAFQFLDNSFLDTLFEILSNQLNEKFLEPLESLLPDYRKKSGVTVVKDEISLSLCRNDGSNRQCYTSPLTQNGLLMQEQGEVLIKNRINQGTGTVITLIQK